MNSPVSNKMGIGLFPKCRAYTIIDATGSRNAQSNWPQSKWERYAAHHPARLYYLYLAKVITGGITCNTLGTYLGAVIRLNNQTYLLIDGSATTDVQIETGLVTLSFPI
jgi:hypothetical protein